CVVIFFYNLIIAFKYGIFHFIFLHANSIGSDSPCWQRDVQKEHRSQRQNPRKKNDRQKQDCFVVLIVIFLHRKQLAGIIQIVQIQINRWSGWFFEVGVIFSLFTL